MVINWAQNGASKKYTMRFRNLKLFLEVTARSTLTRPSRHERLDYHYDLGTQMWECNFGTEIKRICISFHFIAVHAYFCILFLYSYCGRWASKKLYRKTCTRCADYARRSWYIPIPSY